MTAVQLSRFLKQLEDKSATVQEYNQFDFVKAHQLLVANLIKIRSIVLELKSAESIIVAKSILDIQWRVDRESSINDLGLANIELIEDSIRKETVGNISADTMVENDKSGGLIKQLVTLKSHSAPQELIVKCIAANLNNTQKGNNVRQSILRLAKDKTNLETFGDKKLDAGNPSLQPGSAAELNGPITTHRDALALVNEKLDEYQLEEKNNAYYADLNGEYIKSSIYLQLISDQELLIVARIREYAAKYEIYNLKNKFYHDYEFSGARIATLKSEMEHYIANMVKIYPAINVSLNELAVETGYHEKIKLPDIDYSDPQKLFQWIEGVDQQLDSCLSLINTIQNSTSLYKVNLELAGIDLGAISGAKLEGFVLRVGRIRIIGDDGLSCLITGDEFKIVLSSFESGTNANDNFDTGDTLKYFPLKSLANMAISPLNALSGQKLSIVYLAYPKQIKNN